MNRTVNLTKRVQTCKGLRYCTVVLAMNGRVRADLVIVNGREERHPEGAYYLEWWEGGEAYSPVGREGCCRCECSSIAEGSRIECGEPWGRSHPSEREWERTKVAEPHGTGIPCRDQADNTLSRIGL